MQRLWDIVSVGVDHRMWVVVGRGGGLWVERLWLLVVVVVGGGR